MEQTPLHFNFNPDLLKIMPEGVQRVVEVGCSSGALAKAYRSKNPQCIYTGIEIEPEYAEIASQFCNEIFSGNIEQFDDQDFLRFFPSDCWVFGDALEHLYDPWALLRRVRRHMSPNGHIVACIPNAQHWSVQASLCSGLFQDQDQGLMDRTHIRWFTRTTIYELFESTGYEVVKGFPRIFDEPARDDVLPLIRAMASAIGADPAIAVNDAIPLQWVVRAVPRQQE